MIIDPAELLRRMRNVRTDAETEAKEYGLYSQEIASRLLVLNADIEHFLTYGDVVANARRYHVLREACGYVENGTSTSLTISQDDATKYWFIAQPGARDMLRYSGTSLNQAVDQIAYHMKAIKDAEQDNG
ncbi:hypothetical protein [Synechococcus phage Ssp-JY38]|nr:hypothetical protein [Synechococcus phage Yong-L2-223]